MAIFKVKPDPTFVGKVKIPQAGAEPAEISVTFKHKTREEMDDFLARASKSKGKDQDMVLLMEIMGGWSGVDTDFSEAAVNHVITNYQGAIVAIMDAYIGELTQARRKN